MIRRRVENIPMDLVRYLVGTNLKEQHRTAIHNGSITPVLQFNRNIAGATKGFFL